MSNKKNRFQTDFTVLENISAIMSKKTLGSLLMFFSGVFILFLVGFAQGSGNIIHNAAHDARHASGFPCH